MATVAYSLEEYILISVVIILCVSVIVYFTCKRSASLSDYVWGDNVGLFPVSMSLVATNVTGVAVMYSAEIYQFGGNICFEVLPIVACAFVILLQIPKLHSLKLVSLNEYIEMRFGPTVKNAILPLLYISQVVNTMAGAYSISIFISQVSNVSDFNCFLIVMASCYVLTSLGGFKGVIWTDTCFALAVYISSTVITVIAVGQAGGITHIFNAALEGDRLTVDWDPDITKRSTFWSMSVGIFGPWLAFSTLFNPMMYQRYASLPERTAKKAIVIHFTALIAFKLFSFLCGYTIYALYEGCDPVLSGQIKKYDEILGYFAEQFGNTYPILRSMFIICNVSAAVSTLSTIMGTFSVTFYKDVLQKRLNRREDDTRGKRLIQLVGLALTLVSIALIYVFGSSGTVLELAIISAFPLTIYGAVLCMGLWMPRVNSKGVLWGTGLSFVLCLWMVIGSRLAVKNGLIVNESKPMRLDKCPENYTLMAIPHHDLPNNVPFYLYRISPYWQNFVAFSTPICVSWVVSVVLNAQSEQSDRKRVNGSGKLSIHEVIPLSTADH